MAETEEDAPSDEDLPEQGVDEAEETPEADEAEAGEADAEETSASSEEAEASKQAPTEVSALKTGTPEVLPGAGTPEGEALARAHGAFEQGNYQMVRRLCDPLLVAQNGDVAQGARELRRRTEVDPVQIGVLLACLVLFGVITYVYVLT